MESCQSHVKELLELLMDDKIQWNEALDGSFEFRERHDRVIVSIEEFIADHKPVITNPSSQSKNASHR